MSLIKLVATTVILTGAALLVSYLKDKPSTNNDDENNTELNTETPDEKKETTKETSLSFSNYKEFIELVESEDYKYLVIYQGNIFLSTYKPINVVLNSDHNIINLAFSKNKNSKILQIGAGHTYVDNCIVKFVDESEESINKLLNILF